MRSKLCLFFIIFSFLFAACSPFSKIPGRKKAKLETYGINAFNGNYSIYKEKDSLPTLYNVLSMKYNVNAFDDDSNAYIGLEALNDYRVKASLYVDDKLVEDQILKGKIKDNYFELKRKYKFNLKYVILNLSASNKNRMFLTPDGNLGIDSVGGGCALLVFFPIFCADSERYSLHYTRRQPDQNFEN